MYNKNMNKGKICTIKDMDRINKRRNQSRTSKQEIAAQETKLKQLSRRLPINWLLEMYCLLSLALSSPVSRCDHVGLHSQKRTGPFESGTTPVS